MPGRSDRIGHEVGAILVAERKTQQQVFNRQEPDALEIRRAPRADAFHELEWRRKHVGGHSWTATFVRAKGRGQRAKER